MGKRKTHDQSATGWNKRHKGNTSHESDTALMIAGSSNETQNRKGQLRFYIIPTNLMSLTTIVHAETQRIARSMRRAIILSKRPIRIKPNRKGDCLLWKCFLKLTKFLPNNLPNSGQLLFFLGSKSQSKAKKPQSQKQTYNGILECPFCQALVWEKEKKGTRNKTPLFSICCQQGRVKLPPELEAPPVLKKLLSSTQFQRDIRTYNSILAFTSMGAQMDQSVMHKTGPFTYRIHGQNAHRIGSLVPEPGKTPKFSQLYIVDTANEIRNRISTVSRTAKVGELDPNIVKELVETMDTYNCLTKIFRKARDLHESGGCEEFSIKLTGKSKRNRQYDLPQTDEIAGLIVGDFNEDMGERDIVVQHRSSGLQHISDMHPLFMTLQYPLLFPYGQAGFNENIHVTNTDGNTRKREYITKREFFAYQIQTRLDEGMVIVGSKRLLHQYIVDAYTCIEQERLRWFRLNQKKIRADLYNNVEDAVMNGDTDAKSIGKRVILPSSHTGSPRYMAEKYHDAMAICRWEGNPDLFITFTTNPKWEEISDHLKMYGSDDPNDRPDLEARVFKMKLDEMISDFNKGVFFPRAKAGLIPATYNLKKKINPIHYGIYF